MCDYIHIADRGFCAVVSYLCTAIYGNAGKIAAAEKSTVDSAESAVSY